MFRRLVSLPFVAVRRLRWTIGSWSKASDREYHDHLYQAQDYDPFRLDYPGYVTIRRFADHADALMPASGTVLDVGCGPGEITCELARRHPALSFVGIDHSEQAIQRARRNAEPLGLTNIRFAVSDAEALPPEDRYGLVTMFDAFHHLEHPRTFLDWLRARTTRCVLIEPAGTKTGRWARELDLDWLLMDLANIRDRLEAACGEAMRTSDAVPDAAKTGERQPASDRGEGAVERRYALEDFERFFAGWQLRVTGTVAGFDAYPPQPFAQGGLRPLNGDVAYALICATEDLLQQRDRDGAAKHWVIAATSEAGVLQPRLPSTAAIDAREAPPRRVASAFDVRYERYDGPTRVAVGLPFRATIEIRNAGWSEWRSDGDPPVRASYHWLNVDYQIWEFDGVRTDLPHPVGPSDGCRVFLTVTPPAEPGDYILAIDLVQEGVTWFSQAGIPWHTVEILVSPPLSASPPADAAV